MAVIDWPAEVEPKLETSSDISFRGTKAKFGDGYTEVKASRIFPEDRIETLSVQCFSIAARDNFLAFLRSVGKANYIRYTIPSEDISIIWRIVDGSIRIKTIGYESWECSLRLEMENVGT